MTRLTFRVHRFVGDRRDEPPQAVLSGVRLFKSVAALYRTSLLLRQDHVHGLHELPLVVDDIVLRHGVDEVSHAGEGKVDGTEAGQNRHHRDTDDSDPRHSLFDCEDSSVDA